MLCYLPYANYVLLAIVLSFLLRYTDSDCPFGIFKLFLSYFCLNRISVSNIVKQRCFGRVTRRVQLVERELLTFPEHLSSFTSFTGVHVTQSSVSLCSILWTTGCPSFLLIIVLSDILRFITFEYPFGIEKLFVLSTSTSTFSNRMYLR